MGVKVLKWEREWESQEIRRTVVMYTAVHLVGSYKALFNLKLVLSVNMTMFIKKWFLLSYQHFLSHFHFSLEHENKGAQKGDGGRDGGAKKPGDKGEYLISCLGSYILYITDHLNYLQGFWLSLERD